MGYNKTETAKGEICDNYHQLTVEALDPLSQNPIAALFAKMLKNDLFGVESIINDIIKMDSESFGKNLNEIIRSISKIPNQKLIKYCLDGLYCKLSERQLTRLEKIATLIKCKVAAGDEAERDIRNCCTSHEKLSHITNATNGLRYI